MIVDHLKDHEGTLLVQVGDEVENEDARFFVGSINDSQRLCFIDKTKPFTLKNPGGAFANCIKQGNYGATAHTLSRV
jgi:hypothetical protein